MAQTPYDVTAESGPVELQSAAEGRDWQDVALPLRLLLSRGISLAIATVLAARGAAVRQPGSVLVVTEAGQTIGFNLAGPLDGAMDVAAALGQGSPPPSRPIGAATSMRLPWPAHQGSTTARSTLRS